MIRSAHPAYHTAFSAISEIQAPHHRNNQTGYDSPAHLTHARTPAPDASCNALPFFLPAEAHISEILLRWGAIAGDFPARGWPPVCFLAKFPDVHWSASAAAWPLQLPDQRKFLPDTAYPARDPAIQRCRCHPPAPDLPTQILQRLRHLLLLSASAGYLHPRPPPATDPDYNLRQTEASAPARPLFSASDIPSSSPPSSLFCSKRQTGLPILLQAQKCNNQRKNGQKCAG